MCTDVLDEFFVCLFALLLFVPYTSMNCAHMSICLIMIRSSQSDSQAMTFGRSSIVHAHACVSPASMNVPGSQGPVHQARESKYTVHVKKKKRMCVVAIVWINEAGV